jgi:NAD(P)-dependent dehydrogenase (short-subunit alcohol dehydrogenase family)
MRDERMAPDERGLLDGKRILVTGGSRGLGQALCAGFATEGARVAFTWTRDEAGAEQTLARCPEARGYRVSVLDVPGTEAMVRELEQTWGGLDVLVNNTGVSQTYPVALLEEEDWDRVMDVNVKGAFLTSRAVLPGMVRRKGGVILNIGSIAGARMLEAPVHYCASKAALKGLTQALAKELSRYQVRVLCLAPGLLEEGMGQNLPDSAVADYLKHCALGRLGTLEEVARFAAFLVSDHNGYMSGETIIMDGGV